MALIRLAFLLLVLSGAALADDRRAQVNYMLHCQGCHLPEAEGFEGKVPPMKDYVGYFLHSQDGREFNQVRVVRLLGQQSIDMMYRRIPFPLATRIHPEFR